MLILWQDPAAEEAVAASVAAALAAAQEAADFQVAEASVEAHLAADRVPADLEGHLIITIITTARIFTDPVGVSAVALAALAADVLRLLFC